jgi:ubiquinone/menaquinone biosynthesis C-methylase UbiE
MNEKLFAGDLARLRAPERVARLEVARVVEVCLEGADVKAVLDVGTGTGLFAEAFVQRGLTVAGVDTNPAMIEAVQTYVPAGNFQAAPAEILPYPDAAFDLVFMGLVLHESDEPLKVLIEARRVARQRVSILEWTYREESFGPPLAHRVVPDVLAQWAQQAGFSKVETLPLTYLVLYRLTPDDRARRSDPAFLYGPVTSG